MIGQRMKYFNLTWGTKHDPVWKKAKQANPLIILRMLYIYILVDCAPLCSSHCELLIYHHSNWKLRVHLAAMSVRNNCDYPRAPAQKFHRHSGKQRSRGRIDFALLVCAWLHSHFFTKSFPKGDLSGLASDNTEFFHTCNKSMI